jgi:hypothetical protein
MPNCKKILLLSVFTLLFSGLCGGAVFAGADGTIPDAVTFSLETATVFVAGTTEDPDNELATLDFKVTFDADHDGSLGHAVIKLEYDPDYLTFVAVRPDERWDVLVEFDETLTVDETVNPAVLTYIIGPVSSTIPATTSATTLAQFDFEAKCQAELRDNAISIVGGLDETRVNREDPDGSSGEDDYYVSDPTDVIRLIDGGVSIKDYVGSFWLAAVDETPGGVGELVLQGVRESIIDVPLYIQSNFKVSSIGGMIDFDDTRLQYVGQVSCTGNLFSPFASGTCPIAMNWSTDEDRMPRQEFSEPTAFVKLRFQVLEPFVDGETVRLSFVGTTWENIAVAMNDESCAPLAVGDGGFHDGDITIEEYEAEFVTEFTDGGTISDHDCEVGVMINMSNNFATEAAQYSIIVNILLGTDWGYIPYSIDDDVSIDFDQDECEGDIPAERTLAFRSAEGSESIGIQNTELPLVGYSLDAFVGAPVSFGDRWFPINYSADYCNNPLGYTKVRDITGDVELTEGNRLTWDVPEVEYIMGEYSAQGVTGGRTGNVTQTYKTRTNYDLDAFRVKIEVSGPHHIWMVNPLPGVEVVDFDMVSYDWVILRSTPGVPFGQGPTTTGIPFATIEYTRNSGTDMLPLILKETPGDVGDPGTSIPPRGYWVTKTSTVSFVYDDPYYMAEAGTGLWHHTVASAGNVVSRWWVDPMEEQEQHRLYGLAIPDDYALLQNFPNPFNPATEIAFGLPQACRVELVVYNIAGQLVETLVSGHMDAGWHTFTWDGAGFASGIYLYRLQAGEYAKSQKMILLK